MSTYRQKGGGVRNSLVIFSNIFPQCSQIMVDQITSMRCSIGKCGQCKITLFWNKIMSVIFQIHKKYVLGLHIVINWQYQHFKQRNIFQCSFIKAKNRVTSVWCCIGIIGQCEITLFWKKIVSLECQIHKKYVLGLDINIKLCSLCVSVHCYYIAHTKAHFF